jgi:adenine-specific DNA-methyltransferase
VVKLSSVPIRYMGTKRVLAPIVRGVVDDLTISKPVVDLFSGMGSVACSLAPRHSVVTNDLLSFTTAIARSRFMSTSRRSRDSVLKDVVGKFREHHAEMSSRYNIRLKLEREFLASGREALMEWFDTAPHVGNSGHYLNMARNSKMLLGDYDYRLATLYFATGYFSTAQAIEIDSIRFAIDKSALNEDERDWAIGAWLVAAGRLVNSPGHTAQYLRPTSDLGFERIRRSWRRTVWPLFVTGLEDLQSVGTKSWRKSNRVMNCEALSLLDSLNPNDVGAIYADPPYTKDQYSRFYHVYETLYKYDFPKSSGRARARGDRFSTGFSLAKSVEESMSNLIERTTDMKRPLILSYPKQGLLSSRGISIEDVIARFGTVATKIEIQHAHSTMGGSQGMKHKHATECIYVVR